MKNPNTSFQAGLLMGLLMRQNQDLQQLVEAQQQIIALQQQVQQMTPPQPDDKEVSFHLQSGLLSDEAATSEDMRVVQAYQQWVFVFLRKFVKPYVNQKVFQEVSTHMLRGVVEQMAYLENKPRPKAAVPNGERETADPAKKKAAVAVH